MHNFATFLALLNDKCFAVVKNQQKKFKKTKFIRIYFNLFIEL